MSDTAITTSQAIQTEAPRRDLPAPPPSPPRPSGGPGMIFWKAVKVAASLRLTVVLFVLSMFLVFCGTLAQVDSGIWTVMQQYFRTFIAWIPFQVFVYFGRVFLGVSNSFNLAGSFPFPGGLLLGTLLFVNLLAAHIVRFRLTWRRSGILILHSGVVVLMLGELVTGQCAVEAKMTLAIGETVDFVDIGNSAELVIIDSSDPEADEVWAIPGQRLRQGGTIADDQLPVDVEVIKYENNSFLKERKEGEPIAPSDLVSNAGIAFRFVATAEEAGVKSSREDAPAVRVKLRRKGSQKPIGDDEYLLSMWFYPNYTQRLPAYEFAPRKFELDGKTYTIQLRPRRRYKDYSVQLKQFHHELYPGTKVPKDFASDVRLREPQRDEDRPVKIWMNHPLRYRGETFYQSGFLFGDRGTILQVVDNPGWLLPYVACTMITGGMLVHFLLQLISFLQRRVVT